MPQEMNVLRCYSCNMYQVHIAKKSNKWQCKICNEKQSIQAIHFNGSGSDCRKQVQRLNLLKAANDSRKTFRCATIQEFGLDCTADDDDDGIEPCCCPSRAGRSAGKWAKYAESDDQDDDSFDDPFDKENLTSSQENSGGLGTLRKRCEQSHSLPPTQINSTPHDESDQRSAKTITRSFKSRTYPLINNSRKITNEWNDRSDLKEGSSGKVTDFRDEFSLVESVSESSSFKRSIFEDPNDDLDITIDF